MGTRFLHPDVSEEALARIFEACAEEVDGVVDNQEAVVVALADVDGDGGVLLIVTLYVQLLLRTQRAGVDGCRDTCSSAAMSSEGSSAGA